MIKELILNYITKKNIPFTNKPFAYKEANKVALIYNTDQAANQGLQDFILQLKKDDKQITQIPVSDAGSKNQCDGIFTLKNISFTGKFKVEELKNIVNEKYDVIIELENEVSLIGRYLLKTIRGGLTVGIINKRRLPYIDLQLKPRLESSKYHELIDYLRQIR